MAAKLLIGFGVVIMILGGGLYLTQQLALQTAASSFQNSVQQYASESAAVGLVFAQGLAGLGALVIVCGALVGVAGAFRRRTAAPPQA
jgi:hypothetical protein